MQIRVVAGEPSAQADALIVGVAEGGHGIAGGNLGGGASSALGAATAGGDFTGKSGQTLVLYPGGDGPKRLVAVGLGKGEERTAEATRRAVGRGVRRAYSLGAHALGIVAPASDDITVEAVAEAAALAAYDYNKYHTLDADERAQKYVDSVEIVVPAGTDTAPLTAAAALGRALAESANFARDLVTAPGNELSPTAFGDAARRMAAESGLKCEVLGPDQMRELGMGAILGVAQGSAEPPAFIVLEYEPAGATDSTPTVVFVGKGITFDTGGISIKPSEGMGRMKTDMGGGAATVGAMQAVAAVKPAVRVVGLVAATENMPSGTAFRPGDVLTSMAGVTIEIISTDAEGRLVLADALHYAKRYKPAGVVDLATLTGACVVALGHECSGAFTNDEGLVARVIEAGESTGERVWQLPLWPEYDEAIKSDIADVKNSGGRPGGAILGAGLLKKFVDYPWVHLDIAGVAWSDKERPYTPKGATGYGVRLLAQLVRTWPAG